MFKYLLYFLGGTTIHTGLDFKFGGQYLPLLDEAREKIRLQFEDLQLIIIDEMSMVSVDMLYMIHKRLCEIFVSEDYFGGKAIILVGDLMQLRPVKAKYIFDKPKNPKYQPLYEVDSLWRSFKPIILETNFRQGKDSDWSQILNRARIGELTDNDRKILETRRIDPLEDKELYAEAFHVFWTNNETENHNLQKLNELPTPIEEFKARIIAPPSFRPKITSYGTIDDTQFRKNLKLKVGARVMVTLNIDISDSLINGAIGTVVHFVKSEDLVSAILVTFDDENVGETHRNANRHLIEEIDPNATPIFKSTLEYAGRNRSGNYRGIKIKITQYALRLSWASTCHKIQGITISKGRNLVAHGHAKIPPAMQYVMMGRVSNLENLYLSPNFDLAKVRCNKKALAEKIRLDEIYSQRQMKNYDIVFLNVRSLRANHEDLKLESFVQNSKFVCLAETWMYEDEENRDWPKILNKNATFSHQGKGKGCCVYYDDKEVFQNVKKFSSEKFQMICGFTKNNIQLYTLYISKNADFDFITQKLKEWMIPGPMLVIGDFNFEAGEVNSLSNFLYSQGLIQVVKRPTHVEGGIIDHCYVNADWKYSIKIDYIFPYYTDHAAICLSLPSEI